MSENDLLQLTLNLGDGWKIDDVTFSLEDKWYI